MPITLDQNVLLSEGAHDVLSVNCTEYLDENETVASATIAEVTTSDLTLGACVVNATSKLVRGTRVAIGMAISATIRGQLAAHSPYHVLITLTTSAGRVWPFNCLFRVE